MKRLSQKARCLKTVCRKNLILVSGVLYPVYRFLNRPNEPSLHFQLQKLFFSFSAQHLLYLKPKAGDIIIQEIVICIGNDHRRREQCPR